MEEEVIAYLGEEFIRSWEVLYNQKAPSQLNPLFVGFFIWENILDPESRRAFLEQWSN